jgi:hypothetical protein
MRSRKHGRRGGHLRIPVLGAGEMMLLKLHGVEHSGIWIESQDFTNRLMEQFQFNSSVTTPLVFIPFQKIAHIMAYLDSLSLSESALGL